MTQKPSAADQIRTHLERVSHLRKEARTAGLDRAVHEVKQLQAQRFRATYADFLTHPVYAPATRFFLEELYGVHDFAQRDAQFARIAGAIERLFPQAVAQLAVDLAEIHALTEVLDHQMAKSWMAQDTSLLPVVRYTRAWRQTGQADARGRQLAVVQHMGLELERLTRMKPLRLALRMMRNPARAAGLDVLQHFLESGFDAFASLGNARAFLDTISAREADWISILFEQPESAASSALAAELAKTTNAA
ncbi:FFLEELY motif protein [Hydrogenophaga laconesensis]|uniref:DUF8198 domain-containing protein n=1 Tax=Hydrogenophaga laconesensis TaxID=1805971 RepID=A0ABU1VI93_9BURK|nr:hypothetical protein [Hydrogenophaga laconesensis]MDR7096898.1 hypothetical protein [Hydrogenophaga laconesensis]